MMWTLNLGHMEPLNEKGWNASVSSPVWEASLPSLTQPTQVGIVFRILKATYAGVGWSGLWDYERLPHLQRHSGGQYWRTATMSMREWQSICSGGCQEATCISSCMLNEGYWTHFRFLLGTAWEGGQGPRQWGVRSHTKTSRVQIWAHVETIL